MRRIVAAVLAACVVLAAAPAYAVPVPGWGWPSQNASDPDGAIATPAPAAPLPFDASRALAHVAALAGLGPRVAGSRAERHGFDYIAAHLRASGYRVTTLPVPLPNGKSSSIVVCELAGASSEVVVLGAHVDSKYPSPGANDNASGVGTLLELARDLRGTRPSATVRFAFFGAEEMIDANPDHHHYGSRRYVWGLNAAKRDAIAGAVSVDMVGYGSAFTVRNMGVARDGVVTPLLSLARSRGLPASLLRDPSRYGWSDHEPFERVGIPSAWVEWRTDPVYHTRADVYSHVNPRRVRQTGELLHAWVAAMTPAELAALR